MKARALAFFSAGLVPITTGFPYGSIAFSWQSPRATSAAPYDAGSVEAPQSAAGAPSCVCTVHPARADQLRY